MVPEPARQPFENSQQNRVWEYLQRNPLCHILHLKMLTHHGRLVKTTHITTDSGEGILLTFPTTALSYDHQKYGNYELVAMPVSDSPAVLERLLNHIPPSTVIFKLIQKSDETHIKTRFAGSRVRSFLNFTAVTSNNFPPDPDVRITTQLNNELVAAFRQNGHTPTELARFFADGGQALFIKKDNQIASAGMIYRNFNHIWEIAALFTHPAARRNGYSKRIVKTALHTLQQQCCIPRFVVDSENIPSIKLAQSVGLEQFLTVTHFTTRESIHALHKKSHLA